MRKLKGCLAVCVPVLAACGLGVLAQPEARPAAQAAVAYWKPNCIGAGQNVQDSRIHSEAQMEAYLRSVGYKSCKHNVLQAAVPCTNL